jgi:LysM repeat protein
MVGISHENIRGIISSAIDVSDVSATAVGKSAKIDGKIALTLIACEINDDGSAGYIPIKHSFDFTENVNISSQISDNSVIRCTLSYPVVEALIDGDEVEVKCSFSATLSVACESVMNKLDSLNVLSDVESKKAAYVSVYYPTPNDTLFSVAKRYHKTLASVAEANSLSDSVSISDIKGSPVGVKKLFIV